MEASALTSASDALRGSGSELRVAAAAAWQD